MKDFLRVQPTTYILRCNIYPRVDTLLIGNLIVDYKYMLCVMCGYNIKNVYNIITFFYEKIITMYQVWRSKKSRRNQLFQSDLCHHNYHGQNC